MGKVPARPVAYRDVEGWVPDFRSPGHGAGSVPQGAAGESVSLARPNSTECDAASLTAAHPTSAATDCGRADRPTGRRGGSAAPGHLVQGELALSAVQVVRNDLYADDLELIPRAGAGVGRMTLRPDRPRSVVARGGWRGWLAHWRQWLRRGAR
jgi:hypothetical protein